MITLKVVGNGQGLDNPRMNRWIDCPILSWGFGPVD